MPQRSFKGAQSLFGNKRNFEGSPLIVIIFYIPENKQGYKYKQPEKNRLTKSDVIKIIKQQNTTDF